MQYEYIYIKYKDRQKLIYCVRSQVSGYLWETD